jgi:hypothetical protein
MAALNRREFMKTTLASLGAGLTATWAGAMEGTTTMSEPIGRLFYSDLGRVLLEHNEEVSRWRQARKTLALPLDDPQGELYLFLGEYEGNAAPLIVSVNGRETAVPPTGKSRGLHWEKAVVPKGALKRGENEVVLSTPSDAPATWVLGAEMVAEAKTSALSLDGGATWVRRGMGVYGLTPAEYVVRLWVENAPALPNTVYRLIRERPDHPQLAALRRHFRLDETIKGKTHTFDQARAISTQVALLWKVGQAPPGYGFNCPWDAFTITSWMNQKSVHLGKRPVAYCVHFAIVMVQFCAAVGIIARPVVMEEDLPECPTGHFCCEVWAPEWKRWVFFDPDADAVYEHQGQVLSMAQLSDACLAGYFKEVKRLDGPGYGNDPRITGHLGFAKFEKYEGFRRWAVYPRTDFFSSPDVHPVQHGATEYREPQFIWYADPRLSRRRWHPNYTDDLAALYAPPV